MREQSKRFGIEIGIFKQRTMKLVWCPETASKAYIDTVKSCEDLEESNVAELVSATAAGWKAKMIVEAWSRGGVISTSIGLAVASRHTGGRHVCVVQDERSRSEYVEAMVRAGGGGGEIVVAPPEVIVGEAKEVMMGIPEVDFLVVDFRRKDFAGILKVARFSHSGAVVVCKHANPSGGASFRWRGVLPSTTRVVRTVFLPLGKGLDIVHIGSSSSSNSSGEESSIIKETGRWIRHVDEKSGEEHLFRK